MEKNLEKVTTQEEEVTNSLRLIISPLQKMEAIKFNYDELKAALVANLEKYKNLVYTAENVKEAKDDRATLNALKKSMNDEKIRIKKEFNKPYDDFETKIKELIELVDQPASEIDKQVKAFEEVEKVKKREVIDNIYAENIGEYAKLIPLTKIYDSRWENKTYKETDITKEIQDVVKKADNDIKVIEDLQSEFEVTVKNYYFETLDLGQALVKNNELMKQKEILSTPKEEPTPEPVVAINDDAVDAVAYVVEDIKEAVVIEKATIEEKTVTVTFSVETTPEKLTALGQYLKENNIKYWRAQ